MNILLINSPFCTPTSLPYSIINIYSFLKNNLKDDKIDILDLNLKFHDLEFSNYKEFLKTNQDLTQYKIEIKEFLKNSKEIYKENNKKIVENKTPKHFNKFIKEILNHKPDIVAFSLVYSSQCFYTHSIIKRLKKHNIKTIIGGPAINKKLKDTADKTLNNELELLYEIKGKKIPDKKINFNKILDYSYLIDNNYFTKFPIAPIKTSNTCYYKLCAFCTHPIDSYYLEYPLEHLEESIKNSNISHFFIIDDMIHKKRLLEIAKFMKKHNKRWMCQLKPTKDLDLQTLKTLKDSGLDIITWGVESGNDRILRLMRKGTNTDEIKKVLKDSKQVKIKNVLFIMFGFPTETKDEFLQTIDFLKNNKKNIYLISTSIFGLQKESHIYKNPKLYNITKITETKRTILEPKISYKTSKGLSDKQVKQLQKDYKKTLESINNYPKPMNFFKEHMFFYNIDN